MLSQGPGHRRRRAARLALGVAVLGAAAGALALALAASTAPGARRVGLAAAAPPGVATSAPATAEPAPTVTEPGAAPATTPGVPGPASTGPATAPTAPAGPIWIAFWGDSLAWESRDAILEPFAGDDRFVVEDLLVPGLAACDFFARIEARVAAGPLDVAVLEFSGNSGSPCTRDAAGAARTGDALEAQYRDDVGRLVALLRSHGTHVVLAGAPAVRDGGEDRRRVVELYTEMAGAGEGVDVVDMDAVLSPGGRYADRLPCLPFEDASYGCEGGTIAVRAADGLHLCPVETTGPRYAGECGVWASGAHRFGRALADAALRAAGVTL